MTDDLKILKKDTCPTLPGKSKLTYHIGTDAKAEIYLRVSENTGGGFFSHEWVALSAIEKALGEPPRQRSPAAPSQRCSRAWFTPRSE